MKVMKKFDIVVLEHMNYAKLCDMEIKLRESLDVSNKIKILYLENGLIRKAAEVEASIIRMDENINLIKLIMVCKESNTLESFIFGIEPVSLN
jgi:hypothetical protein